MENIEDEWPSEASPDGGATFDVGTSHYTSTMPAHKRMRKPIVRKSVDPNATFVRFITQRRFFPIGGGAGGMKPPHLPPHSFYKRQMLPPLAYPAADDLASCVCTKFCRCSTNKQRCPVNCLTWTPEGRRLITGNSVGEFTLWNGLAFNFETILQAHDDAVRAMVWSHNDNWLVTADHGGVIKYWQPSMTNVQLLQGHREAVRSLSFAPTDFKFVSCSDDATVKIWDFESGREERVLTGHGWDVKCVAYHPQKSLLASGSKDNLVKLWDPKSGNSLNTLHGHKNTVFKVAWNDNGNWLLTASRDQLIKIYDLRMLREMATLRGHAREVTSLAWHPWYEKLFVSGSYDGSLMYWEVGKENALASIPQAHDMAVWDVQWHPVGHVLASGSNDYSTKFWSRNRPGDPMDDKYNGGQTSLEGEGFVEETEAPAPAPVSNNVLPGMGVGASSLPSEALSNVNLETLQAKTQAVDNSNKSSFHRPPPDNYTCNRCGTKGHWIEDCPTRDQGYVANNNGQRRIPPDGYLCKRCNIPGHYISDCTEPKVPPPNYTCHKCRQKGHWKQDCPLDPANASAGQNGPSGGPSGGPPPPRNGPFNGMQPPPRPSMGMAPPPPQMMNAGMKRGREDNMPPPPRGFGPPGRMRPPPPPHMMEPPNGQQNRRQQGNNYYGPR